METEIQPHVIEWLKANRPGYLEDVEKAQVKVAECKAKYDEVSPAYDEVRKEIQAELDAIQLEIERLAPKQADVDYMERVEITADRMAKDEYVFTIYSNPGTFQPYPSFNKMVQIVDPNISLERGILSKSGLDEPLRLYDKQGQINFAHQEKHREIYRAFDLAKREWNLAKAHLKVKKLKLMQSADIAEAFMHPQEYLKRIKIDSAVSDDDEE